MHSIGTQEHSQQHSSSTANKQNQMQAANRWQMVPSLRVNFRVHGGSADIWRTGILTSQIRKNPTKKNTHPWVKAVGWKPTSFRGTLWSHVLCVSFPSLWQKRKNSVECWFGSIFPILLNCQCVELALNLSTPVRRIYHFLLGGFSISNWTQLCSSAPGNVDI